MKKIPTLFKRDPTTHLVTPESNVILPDGAVPTVKWDGSAVMFDGDQWWKRREVKPNKPIPEGYVEVDHDPVTGKRQGWMPITDGPEDKWFREAIYSVAPAYTSPGTYEAVGPHFQGDPHLLHFDTLKRHGVDTLIEWGDLFGVWPDQDDFYVLQGLVETDVIIEGAVWWFEDQPVAKLKRRDFGFVWPLEEA